MVCGECRPCAECVCNNDAIDSSCPAARCPDSPVEDLRYIQVCKIKDFMTLLSVPANCLPELSKVASRHVSSSYTLDTSKMHIFSHMMPGRGPFTGGQLSLSSWAAKTLLRRVQRATHNDHCVWNACITWPLLAIHSLRHKCRCSQALQRRKQARRTRPK
jgi:hypothetical protein